MTKRKETIYLAGKITGDPDYREKFAKAARTLREAGYVVLNPAMLPPEGFTYRAYLRMGYALLDECDMVCLLPDWEGSYGARLEFVRAAQGDKRVMFYDVFLQRQRERRARETSHTNYAHMVPIEDLKRCFDSIWGEPPTSLRDGKG